MGEWDRAKVLDLLNDPAYDSVIGTLEDKEMVVIYKNLSILVKDIRLFAEIKSSIARTIEREILSDCRGSKYLPFFFQAFACAHAACKDPGRSAILGV